MQPWQASLPRTSSVAQPHVCLLPLPAAQLVNGANANKFPPLGAIKWHRLVLDEAHTVSRWG